MSIVLAKKKYNLIYNLSFSVSYYIVDGLGQLLFCVRTLGERAAFLSQPDQWYRALLRAC
jgi:hypothetical protein